jgi:F-type H+-transporting ATPase subunit b
MAAPTATTEAPAQHGFPPFETQYYLSEILWLALSFVLLYALMSKVVLPRIGAIFAERNKRIAEDMATAQGLKQRSEAAHAAYEKALADARTRAHNMANAARERETAAAMETNRRLEAQLHERLAAAEKSIAATRATAMSNVGSIAAEAASAIVERLIGQKPPAGEVAAALADRAKR